VRHDMSATRKEVLDAIQQNIDGGLDLTGVLVLRGVSMASPLWAGHAKSCLKWIPSCFNRVICDFPSQGDGIHGGKMSEFVEGR
jgi:hypothetical protein